MPMPVLTLGAQLKCPFGAAPANVISLPTKRVLVAGKPVVTANDNKPFVNITPCGTCFSPTNPAVVAAQGAPVPCTPNIVTPFLPPKAQAQAGGDMGVDISGKVICAFSGGAPLVVINPGHSGQVQI